MQLPSGTQTPATGTATGTPSQSRSTTQTGGGSTAGTNRGGSTTTSGGGSTSGCGSGPNAGPDPVRDREEDPPPPPPPPPPAGPTLKQAAVADARANNETNLEKARNRSYSSYVTFVEHYIGGTKMGDYRQAIRDIAAANQAINGANSRIRSNGGSVAF